MTANRMRVAATLWRNGISAEFGYQENPKLQKQLAFALESGINWVVIMGEEEWKEGNWEEEYLRDKMSIEPIAGVTVDLETEYFDAATIPMGYRLVLNGEETNIVIRYIDYCRWFDKKYNKHKSETDENV